MTLSGQNSQNFSLAHVGQTRGRTLPGSHGGAVSAACTPPARGQHAASKTVQGRNGASLLRGECHLDSPSIWA
jgi:hypothetical protein